MSSVADRPYEPRKIIGRRVRAVRKSRGLSQEQFGDAIGYDRTYIGSLERGERNLTLDSVLVLADRLGLDMLDLMTPRPQDATPHTQRPSRRRADPYLG